MQSTQFHFLIILPLDILLLVPRIVLITQNLEKIAKVWYTARKIGVYFGGRKEIKE